VCSWWWAEEPTERCTASVQINKKRCILLPVIWNYITKHGHMNIKNNKIGSSDFECSFLIWKLYFVSRRQTIREHL
jgi:hypothetical protein